MKYLFLDVETTGIESQNCAIIQLSGIIEINSVIQEEFNFYIKPHPGALISPEALSVGNFTQEQIENFSEPYVIYEKFISILEKYVSPYDKKDKFLFCGYNAVFDSDFLRAFFLRNQNKFFSSYFWHPVIDVMFLAAEKLKSIRHTLSNFKLGTIAQHFKVDMQSNQLHDAFFDIKITKQIYEILTHQAVTTTEEKNLSQKDHITNETFSNKDFSEGLF